MAEDMVKVPKSLLDRIYRMLTEERNPTDERKKLAKDVSEASGINIRIVVNAPGGANKPENYREGLSRIVDIANAKRYAAPGAEPPKSVMQAWYEENQRQVRAKRQA